MSLKKQNKLYLSIVYVLWELLAYYESLFKLNVPTDATKLPVKLSVDDENEKHPTHD